MPIWTAFNDLHRARSMGFGIEPLKVADICAYLDTYEIQSEERREWLRLLTMMDQAWMDWANAKREADREPKGGSG